MKENLTSVSICFRSITVLKSISPCAFIFRIWYTGLSYTITTYKSKETFYNFLCTTINWNYPNKFEYKSEIEYCLWRIIVEFHVRNYFFALLIESVEVAFKKPKPFADIFQKWHLFFLILAHCVLICCKCQL